MPGWLRRRNRSKGTPKLRKLRLLTSLIEAQDHTCIGCGEHLTMTNPNTGKDYFENHPKRPTFDHVEPKSKTKKHKGNLLAAHRLCNSKKADRDPTGCELIWLDVVNVRTGRAQQEAIQRRIDAWKKHVDAQEQLSYSDSQRQRIEKETDSCSWDTTRKSLKFDSARA